MSRIADGGSLDPGSNADGNAWETMQEITEGLVRKIPVTAQDLASGKPMGEIEPCLAESWKVSDDGLTWTFTLRKGVKFHDGTTFDADAVIANVDRLLNKSNSYRSTTTPIATTAVFGNKVESYRALNPSTVEFKLTQKYYPFLPNLGVPNAGIVSPAALKKYGQDIGKNPIGTGPFKFVDYTSADHITLERNPEYWDNKAYLDKVIYRIVPDSTVRLAKLRNREIDFIDGVSFDDLDQVKADSNLNVFVLKALGGLNWVFLQTEKKPFDDVRVRQALNYAVNKEEINQFLFKGLATVANSPVPQFEKAYDPSLPGYPYDPQKAKQLLTAAGYPDGFETSITAYQSFLGNPAGGQKLAEVLQQHLSKVGVRLTIQVLDNSSWSPKRVNGDFATLLHGWSGMNPGVPDGVLFEPWYSGNVPGRNGSRIKDPKLDKMLTDAQAELDQTKRTPLYNDIQKYLMDLAPAIFINSAPLIVATQKKVHDIGFDYAFARAVRKAWTDS
jgi:peptide/nickel transport system substrate-binding protein